MKTNLVSRMPAIAVLLAFAALCLSGCQQVPKGGASSVMIETGVSPVFTVEKGVEGIKSDDKAVTAAKSWTKLNILAFFWKSTATDVVLEKQKP